VRLGVKPISTPILLIIALLIASCVARQDTMQKLVDLIKIANCIMDSTFLLNESRELQLYQMIRSLEEERGPQVAVLTTRRLKGSSRDEIAARK
jgi:uncharacterized membrane protein YgcG